MDMERIKNLLFGEGSNISLKRLENCYNHGYIPEFLTKGSARRWKNTFVGDFVCHYLRDYFILNILSEVLGKQPELSDFTESNLEAIVAKLKKRAPGTAKQYASQIKSTITRLLESDDCNEVVPCKRYAKILSLDSCPTTKPYLELDDIKAFLSYEPTNKTERNCKALFSVMLMTGARYSDVVNFKRANIQGGVLTYVPKKTKTSGTVVSIPVSEATIEQIGIIEDSNCDYFVGYFNKTIKSICEKCGITEEVTFFHAGEYKTARKCDAISSHKGRISFVTNMLKLGQQMHEVSKLAGHTDIAMTSRYNASTDVKLTEKADDFINMKF